jgi:DNA-binding NarL/FixJ family response regulator
MTPFPDITLTDRQSAVFEMLVDGLPLETIAARINCAPKTLAVEVTA